ncbi:hypothetical protein D6789_03885 [Candidatus Woesearchaeota archaeon]|nr:MAG: hypothetical protein D6789_03885 [Candidatus Woesearchaeota archaeon]
MLTVAPALAAEVNLVNSRDWTDVYSVMLHSALEGKKSYFVNSESLVAIARTIPQRDSITVYESDNPFIPNLAAQLASSGYTIADTIESDDFNIDLARPGADVVVLSEDSSRLSLPAAAYAKQTGSWVFIVNEDRLAAIADQLPQAGTVLAIGNFRRDYLEQLRSSFDKWVNNNNIYEDSRELALLFPEHRSTVILTDGKAIEAEYFNTKNPVVLSGSNKLVDATYDFLKENGIASVIVVGNSLATVGEQIRARSNKTISVFVKFGQSDAQGLGRIYALTLFPLPKEEIGLTVDRAVYDPSKQQLIAYFRNTGNTGLYELSTLSVKDQGEEIATAADEESVFLGAGEVLPVVYEATIDTTALTNATVEFFTSYGIAPNTLDEFLTMRNRFGPPFALPLEVAEVESGGVSLDLGSVIYYKGLNRIAVTLTNTGEKTAYFRVSINRLIVNGLEEDLVKAGSVAAGETTTVYLPVKLDDIDLQENKEFKVTLVYGASEDALFQSQRQAVPFTYEEAGLLSRLKSPAALAVIGGLVILVILVAFFRRRKSN